MLAQLPVTTCGLDEKVRKLSNCTSLLRVLITFIVVVFTSENNQIVAVLIQCWYHAKLSQAKLQHELITN